MDLANTVVQMYGVTHSDFEAKQWHVFVAYLVSLSFGESMTMVLS
jgi:hypothetical protein